MKSILFILVIIFGGAAAQAYTFEWNGTYRAEYFQMDNTSLGDPAQGKSYLLNYLSLSPRVLISDGYEVTTRFDVLPNSTYENSNLGQSWGRGNSTGLTPPDSAQDSVSMSQSQKGTGILVREMYLTLKQEFGAFQVGRAPFHFGLGINHNSGQGAFDHWGDTYDMLAFKIRSGNLWIIPIVSKIYDPSVDQGSDISDQTIVLDYDNKETGSRIGVMLQERNGQRSVSQYPATLSSNIDSKVKVRNVNFLLGRTFESLSFKMEAGFSSGSTGASDPSGEDILMNGYGIALEVMKNKKDADVWSWGLKTGVATGDNPDTADYEGYAFDRNYDVAMLMFNHPMGKVDVLKSALYRGSAAYNDSYDTESISNAFYLAPELTYFSSEKLSYRGALIVAQVMSDIVAGGKLSKNIGSEFDFSIHYKPSTRIEWINQLGYFAPGAAFQGVTDEKTNTSFGFTSKVSVAF